MKCSKLFAITGIIISGVLMGSNASADYELGNSGDFGLGAVFGAPTGLSAKLWLGHNAAIDGAVAWSFTHDDRLQLNSDYLWHVDLDAKRLNVREGRLPLYLGLGLRVIAGHDSQAGLRLPLGLAWMAERAPVELFAEVVPVLEFAPDTEGDVEGGVGVRYYFKTSR